LQKSSASRNTLLYSLLPALKNRALEAIKKQLLEFLNTLTLLPKLRNRALEANKRQLLDLYNNDVSSNKPIILSIALRYLYIIFCAKYI